MTNLFIALFSPTAQKSNSVLLDKAQQAQSFEKTNHCGQTKIFYPTQNPAVFAWHAWWKMLQEISRQINLKRCYKLTLSLKSFLFDA